MNELDLTNRYCTALDVENDAWPDRIKDQKGNWKLSNTIENLKFLLKKLCIEVKYNVIAKDIEIHTPGEIYGSFDDGKNAALNAIVSECCRYELPKSNTKDYLDAIGYQNQYNPVLDWIKSKPYDNTIDHIDMLCDTVKARDDFDKNFKNLLIKKWLISCVAMANNDSAKLWSKGVLVFQGDQNLGKTYWFWRLFPREHEEWGKEGVILKPDQKDSVLTAVSHWIIELGELDSTFKKSDIAQIKAFLTNRKDKLRRPYGRKDSTYPRRTSFFGSVNPREFLKDETGNSRFWVVPVIGIDYKHGIDIQQMWAQVYELYLSGQDWFLTHEEFTRLEAYNEYSRELSPIEEKIISADWGILGSKDMTASDVLMKIGYDKPTKSDRNTAAAALRKHFGDYRSSRNGRVFRMWET